MRRALIFSVAGVLSLGAMAACGDDDDSTVDEVQGANAAFCENLATYVGSLESFGALDPATATKADYDAAADAVRSAREDLSSSAGDLAEAQWENLQAQAEDLDGAFADAPDDEVVAQIVTDAQTQVAEVRASAATLNTAVCTAGGAATTGG